MDRQLLEQQIAGLNTRLTELRAARDLHIRLQGIEEEAAKVGLELAECEVDHQALKEETADLKARKAEETGKLTGQLTTRMDQILSPGTSIFEISDAGVFIGAKMPGGTRIPYQALSGGQKVIFQQALIYALMGSGPKCLIVEAAELDQLNLDRMLAVLEALPEDCQSIVMTCHGPAAFPAKNWQIVEVSS